MVTVVWDIWVEPNSADAAVQLVRNMFADMRGFDGYLAHQLLVDQDHCGHVIAIVDWHSREDADRMRIRYAESETFNQLTPLLIRARERWVMEEVDSSLEHSNTHIPRPLRTES